MAVKYRACVDSQGVVVAVAYDEGQSGYSEGNDGTWCDFTFDAIPTIPADVFTYAKSLAESPSLLKVVDGVCVSRTLAEIGGV